VSLDVRARVARGPFVLDVELGADAGETVAVLGPNGSGKSTLLRAICGLLPIDAGRIVLDGTVLDDGGPTFVAPDARPVGVVFQDHALFPHLDATDNVAFGLRSRGVPRRTARAAARTWIGRVGLEDRAGARPAALSGGEAQRVALARALAVEPRVLLLDEPLAALDQRVRASVRRDLRGRLREFGGIRLLVTHDPIDAAVLADRIVVLEDGRVAQSGSLADVTARPRSQWIAELVGVNLLAGTGRVDHVDLGAGATLVVPDAGRGEVLAVVHPHSVGLHRDRPTGSARNVWPATVDSVESLGARVRVLLSGAVALTAEITPAARDELALTVGEPVWASVKATDVTVFPD
jgi:molybdate transport system ATP-binding protein